MQNNKTHLAIPPGYKDSKGGFFHFLFLPGIHFPPAQS